MSPKPHPTVIFRRLSAISRQNKKRQSDLRENANSAPRKVTISEKSRLSYRRIIAACPFIPAAFEWTTVPRTIVSGATAP